MLKRNGYSLSDEQVRNIKANMVQGVTLSALSRTYDVSVETLSRIRRGLTYKHIKVLGEEALRPGVEVVAPTEKHIEVLSNITDDDVAESLRRFEQEMAKPEVKAVTEIDALCQGFLGNTPLSRR